MNTLCGKKVLRSKDSDDPSTAHIEEGVKIKPVTVGWFHMMESATLSSTKFMQTLNSMKKERASHLPSWILQVLAIKSTTILGLLPAHHASD